MVATEGPLMLFGIGVTEALAISYTQLLAYN